MTISITRPVIPPHQVSLPDFWDMLNAHDWYYAYSDDHSVWQRGERASKKLEAIAQQSKAHRELMTRFTLHMFSGEAWNTQKEPKPDRPEEDNAPDPQADVSE